MKTILSLLAVLTISITISAQTQMGRVLAYQMVDKEVKKGDLLIHYPGDNLPRFKNNIWLTLELADSRGAFLEVTPDARKKLNEILNAYIELETQVETPKKLPASVPVGDMVIRAAFADSTGKYHVDDFHTVAFFVKFDKKGNKSLGMSIGKLQSKKFSNITHVVPLLWFDHQMVLDFRSEVSEEAFQQFLRNKDKTLNQEVIKILGE
jgi:hypothetical protein